MRWGGRVVLILAVTVLCAAPLAAQDDVAVSLGPNARLALAASWEYAMHEARETKAWRPMSYCLRIERTRLAPKVVGYTVRRGFPLTWPARVPCGPGEVRLDRVAPASSAEEFRCLPTAAQLDELAVSGRLFALLQCQRNTVVAYRARR